MASLEMLDSLWYLQTPERVKNLIKNYTKNTTVDTKYSFYNPRPKPVLDFLSASLDLK